MVSKKQKISNESRTLSILSHIIGLFTSFIGPLVILLISKDDYVKQHSKKALNWQISLILYWIISIILMLILIGIIFAVVLSVLGIVFPIIAAVKASEDKLWDYPITIPFLK